MLETRANPKADKGASQLLLLLQSLVTYISFHIVYRKNGQKWHCCQAYHYGWHYSKTGKIQNVKRVGYGGHIIPVSSLLGTFKKVSHFEL